MQTVMNIESAPLTTTQFVTCVSCRAVQPGGGNWVCRECNESLERGLEDAECRGCGQIGPHMRQWFALKPLCECHLSEAKRRELQRWQQRNEQKKAEEALEQQERELAQQRRAAQHYNASKCWDNDNQRCSISLSSLPYGFCSVCPRFEKNRPGRKQVSPRFGKVEMEEIDCG